MSLLRVSAVAKRLSRRSLFERCVVRAPLADLCQVRVPTRDGAVRRISGTSLQLQKRNVKFVILKRDSTKKRDLEQSQLLDVLEARIQQLQCDIVLDVPHTKLHFLKAPSSGQGFLSSQGPKGAPKEKTDTPKSQKTLKEASKSQPSRSIKKLTQEKHCLNAPSSGRGDLSSQGPKGAPKEKTDTPKSQETLIESKSQPSRWIEKITQEKKKKLLKHKKMKNVKEPIAGYVKLSSTKKPVASKERREEDAQTAAKEQAPVGDLQSSLSQPVSQRTSSSNPLRLLEDTQATACDVIQQSIHSYLEACVFGGEVGRAHRFLLSQHRISTRRKQLNTDIYNIMMRVMAKQGTLNHIGRLFILLEEASLKPNLGSYCSALECMGRNPKSTLKVISRCLSQMEKDGLSLDDLFSQCVFRQDERDMVLKAVRVVQPDYRPGLNASPTPRFSPLVHDLYTQRSGHHYPKLNFTQKELQERFERQLAMEQECSITIDSVETAKPVTEHMARMRKMLADQRAQWQKILLQALRECKKTLAYTEPKVSRLNLYPYLCVLEDRDYVDIMLQCVDNMPLSGESLKWIAGGLGNSVYSQYCVRQKCRYQMMEKLRHVYNDYTGLLAKDTKDYDVVPSEHWRNLETEHNSGPSLQGFETQWPSNVCLELGIIMVDMMVKNLKINSDILNSAFNMKRIPILYHMYAFRSMRQIGFIKPHPILTQIQREAVETKLTFDSYVMPMLCPPVPWTSVKFGAYLLTTTALMRTVDGATQHKELLEKCQNLSPVLDSLNQLGNCAWSINKPLLDIIISIFNDRGSDKLNIPPPLSEAPQKPDFNAIDPDCTFTEKAQMKKELINAKKKYSEMHSLRMDALYKLSIANHMRDEVFWFPHNMDFRGRTYPCPPYFNHLGSDVTRALLVFADGKPLGPKGMDWLKIHLVNLTGLKKRSSLDGRLEYANSIMEDVLDSADNPLNGKKWWMDADEPWQALSCCMEIAKAVRSPDPTRFISHFPVHQDGSCNGLQHYAALGRDVIGATSVNLVPSDVPQDVYSGVAQQVEEFRAHDAQHGLKIAQVLEGLINRKLVKQTVMTVVYGVTRFGARLQIERRLKEVDEFPKDDVWEASHYLVRKVFGSLKEMFTGTREIQDWLTESAKLISKSGHTVEWVTPLGLPIIQPYHRSRNQLEGQGV
ncbi:DNA-directed RNA polymerase, mitochondrial isoform X2 [Clinocottus analis]|uniref:DNA-directed RNA polymerase, mitochondrial isoform X2 n=1 Tax=Clinocottus analis TaxID=304258 RepID=UPI0035C177DD